MSEFDANPFADPNQANPFAVSFCRRLYNISGINSTFCIMFMKYYRTLNVGCITFANKLGIRSLVIILHCLWYSFPVPVSSVVKSRGTVLSIHDY